MLVSCPCLNVAVDTLSDVDENSLRPPENLELSAQDKIDPFFSSFESDLVEVIRKDNDPIVERIPVLVESRKVAAWEIRKCILCGLDVYAINSTASSRLLLNRHLLLKQKDAPLNSNKISEIFHLILPAQSKQLEVALANKFNQEKRIENETKANIVCSALQQLTSDYLQRQQLIIEEKIQKFTEEQNAIFEKIQENAKREKQHMFGCVFGGLPNVKQNGDGADSAVALSPASIVSTGDASTSVTASEPAFIGTSLKPISILDTAQNVLRPKTNSNPVSLTAYKRKRHSGGSTKAPALSTEEADENEGVFSLDEQDLTDDLFPPQWHTGEEVDTDDSGHGEDYGKYYPMPGEFSSVANEDVAKETLPIRPGGFHGNAGNFDEEEPGETEDVYASRVAQFGTSLPVKIPLSAFTMAGTMPTFARIPSTEEEPPADVGASMQALARSIQAVDDPERLFGERPRRRWNTGEMVPRTVAMTTNTRQNNRQQHQRNPQPF